MAGISTSSRLADTLFAPAERSLPEELAEQTELVRSSPFVNGVMAGAGEPLAILNDRREVLAFNHDLVEKAGIHDPQSILGLRLGEVLGCSHAKDDPSGCGTTVFCSQCGSAISIVTALATGHSAEQICIARVGSGARQKDLSFAVRAFPVRVSGRVFVALSLRDVTIDQKRAALERSFFIGVGAAVHRIHEIAALEDENSDEQSPGRIARLAEYLVREGDVQSCFIGSNEKAILGVRTEEYLPGSILGVVGDAIHYYPACVGRTLKIKGACLDRPLRTDISLAARVLTSMLVNALEATSRDSRVELSVEVRDGGLAFCVHNDGIIADVVAQRIFQRNFSTKAQFGRGLGTWSMKRIGEDSLMGKVWFESNAAHGTRFYLWLPWQP